MTLNKGGEAPSVVWASGGDLGSCWWAGLPRGPRREPALLGVTSPHLTGAGRALCSGNGKGPQTTNSNLSNSHDETSGVSLASQGAGGVPLSPLFLQVWGLLELGGGLEDISGTPASSSNRLSQAR